MSRGCILISETGVTETYMMAVVLVTVEIVKKIWSRFRPGENMVTHILFHLVAKTVELTSYSATFCRTFHSFSLDIKLQDYPLTIPLGGKAEWYSQSRG